MGFRKRTRKKLKAGTKHKFKPSDYLKEFKIGSKVVVRQDPSSHKGMPHPRFMGKVGEVTEKRGAAYVIDVIVGKKHMDVIAKPEHLKQITTNKK